MSSTTLAGQLVSLSHAELSTKLNQLRQAVQADEARHAQLAHEHQMAKRDVERLEQQHLFDENETTQVALREARDGLAAARDRLLAHPEKAHHRKAVLAAIADEHKNREKELAAKVTAACTKKWQATGTPEGYIEAARRVMAEAILRFAYQRTMKPTQVEVQAFIEHFLLPLEVAKLVQVTADRERTEAKAAIVKESNGRYS
jgi:hypothetical protein